MKKRVLSKKIGWIILVILVLLDAGLDLIFIGGRGVEFGIWKSVSDFLRIKNPIFLTPLVFVLFYFLIKAGAWLAIKIDKIKSHAEELVLTNLVLVYALFDLWLILVYFFNFTLIKSHFYLTPLLAIIAIIYSIWAEKSLKKSEKVKNTFTKK